MGVFWAGAGLDGLENRDIPCIIRVIRESGRREWFASDCVIRHPVFAIRGSPQSSPEIACGGTLKSIILIALTVPRDRSICPATLNDGGRLGQHHCLQTGWPQSVESNPEQAVERRQLEPTRPLTTRNAHSMAEARFSGSRTAPLRNRHANRGTIDRSRLYMPAPQGGPCQNSRFFGSTGIIGRHSGSEDSAIGKLSLRSAKPHLTSRYRRATERSRAQFMRDANGNRKLRRCRRSHAC
jgi:hypothetical protein